MSEVAQVDVGDAGAVTSVLLENRWIFICHHLEYYRKHFKF